MLSVCYCSEVRRGKSINGASRQQLSLYSSHLLFCAQIPILQFYLLKDYELMVSVLMSRSQTFSKAEPYPTQNLSLNPKARIPNHIRLPFRNLIACCQPQDPTLVYFALTKIQDIFLTAILQINKQNQTPHLP